MFWGGQSCRGMNVGFIAALAMAGAMVSGALAQTKATAPKPQDKVALGEERAKELLLLIDTDKKGLQTGVDEVYGSGV
jgi:hypothetical protein